MSIYFSDIFLPGLSTNRSAANKAAVTPIFLTDTERIFSSFDKKAGHIAAFIIHDPCLSIKNVEAASIQDLDRGSRDLHAAANLGADLHKPAVFFLPGQKEVFQG